MTWASLRLGRGASRCGGQFNRQRLHHEIRQHAQFIRERGTFEQFDLFVLALFLHSKVWAALVRGSFRYVLNVPLGKKLLDTAFNPSTPINFQAAATSSRDIRNEQWTRTIDSSLRRTRAEHGAEVILFVELEYRTNQIVFTLLVADTREWEHERLKIRVINVMVACCARYRQSTNNH